jgi:hypothetical protein
VTIDPSYVSHVATPFACITIRTCKPSGCDTLGWQVDVCLSCSAVPPMVYHCQLARPHLGRLSVPARPHPMNHLTLLGCVYCVPRLLLLHAWVVISSVCASPMPQNSCFLGGHFPPFSIKIIPSVFFGTIFAPK